MVPLSVSAIGKQSGMAGMGILAAMLVVVFVAAIAIKQSWRSDIDLSQAGYRWQGMQANAYIRGAETLALIALEKDKTDNEIDETGEAWAQPFDFPTDHGFMQIRVADAQAKLNLNRLGTVYQQNANGSPLSGAQKYSAEQRQFIRLLQVIEIEEDTFLSLAEAEEIMDALVDWLDADANITGFSGAEQNHYSQLEPPYTMTNGPMLSVSEFSQIKGVSRALYNGLLPYLSALDDGANAWLNANTMDLKLVQTINYDNDLSPMDSNAAQQLFDDIRTNPKESTRDLEDALSLTGVFGASSASGSNSNGASNAPQPDIGNFVFGSGWFDMNVTVTVGDTVKRYASRISRVGAKAKVERRSDANF